MDKKRKVVSTVIFAAVIVLLLLGIILLGAPAAKTESIKEVMKDAVLHESNKVSLFGLMEVNPAVISAFTVTGIVLVLALLIRIIAVPKFRIRKPGKFQLLIETWVGYFVNLAKTNSHHKNKLLSVYIFVAGSYICISTVFELLGLQVMTTEGLSLALPAPLSDINGAIALGVTSYLFILVGGISVNGFKGAGNTLKDFSLPISMSFRLFGALLSGLLVTELVYYAITLSFVLPVIVGVLFTLIHAIIQTYVLTMLVSYFYGEVTEPPKPKVKKAKKEKKRKNN